MSTLWASSDELKIKPRSRLLYVALGGVVIGLGLYSRSASSVLPPFIAAYAGDTLWALLVVFVLGWLFPQLAVGRLLLTAAAFALAIELSQLYHAPWLDHWRTQRLVRLVLGQGFLWSDLLCYAVGIAIGGLFELAHAQFVRRQDLQA